MSDEAQEVTTMDSPDVDSGADVTVSEPEDSVEPVVGDTTQQPDPNVVAREPMQQLRQSDVDYQAELAAARREAEVARAKAEAYESVYSQQLTSQQRAAQEEQEKERLMSMTPEERLLYAAEKQEQRLSQMTMDAERRIREANDRAAYAALKNSNPMARSMEKEVENFVESEKAQGRYIDREVALTYLAGQKALEAAAGGKQTPQRTQAQENIQASVTKSTTGGGDQSPSREKAEDSKEARNERLRQGKRSSIYR